MAKMNIESLLRHNGFVWVTYESPANVSKRSCKALGIDPESCVIRQRVCFNIVRDYAAWCQQHGIELSDGPPRNTGLEKVDPQNDGVCVNSEGIGVIRGAIIPSLRKILSNTTPEGVEMNKPPKKRGNALDNFRSYRLDRVIVEDTE